MRRACRVGAWNSRAISRATARPEASSFAPGEPATVSRWAPTSTIRGSTASGALDRVPDDVDARGERLQLGA
jgi:hypothetical protein